MKFCITKHMKKTHYFFTIALALFQLQAIAQQRVFKDTLDGSSETVVVTANRSERKMGNVAVPVSLIGEEDHCPNRLFAHPRYFARTNWDCDSQ